MKRIRYCAALVMLFMPLPSRAANREDPSRLGELVRDRTGVSLHWSADGADDAATADSVRLLLQGNLTEERAIRVALLNNRGLRADFEEVGISRADYRQALLPSNPTVGAEVRFDGDRRPGEFSVMQDLSSILLAPLRRQAAGASLSRANLMAADAALGIVLETRSAFYGVQAAEQIGRFWEQIVASARSAADLSLRQHEAGNVPSLEVENRQALYE